MTLSSTPNHPFIPAAFSPGSRCVAPASLFTMSTPSSPDSHMDVFQPQIMPTEVEAAYQLHYIQIPLVNALHQLNTDQKSPTHAIFPSNNSFTPFSSGTSSPRLSPTPSPRLSPTPSLSRGSSDLGEQNRLESPYPLQSKQQITAFSRPSAIEKSKPVLKCRPSRQRQIRKSIYRRARSTSTCHSMLTRSRVSEMSGANFWKLDNTGRKRALNNMNTVEKHSIITV